LARIGLDEWKSLRPVFEKVRVPPQLLGIVPSNTGGFGAADTAAQVFGRNEIEPLQARFMELNDWLGDDVVGFKPYVITQGSI